MDKLCGCKYTDDMASAGYDYAVYNKDIPAMETDFDLMAFNAGISNANIAQGLNVTPLLIISCKTYHQARDTESDKTLSIICNH